MCIYWVSEVPSDKTARCLSVWHNEDKKNQLEYYKTAGCLSVWGQKKE
jgi:hypothetical protein